MGNQEPVTNEQVAKILMERGMSASNWGTAGSAGVFQGMILKALRDAEKNGMLRALEIITPDLEPGDATIVIPAGQIIEKVQKEIESL